MTEKIMLRGEDFEDALSEGEPTLQHPDICDCPLCDERKHTVECSCPICEDKRMQFTQVEYEEMLKIHKGGEKNE